MQGNKVESELALNSLAQPSPHETTPWSCHLPFAASQTSGPPESPWNVRQSKSWMKVHSWQKRSSYLARVMFSLIVSCTHHVSCDVAVVERLRVALLVGDKRHVDLLQNPRIASPVCRAPTDGVAVGASGERLAWNTDGGDVTCQFHRLHKAHQSDVIVCCCWVIFLVHHNLVNIDPGLCFVELQATTQGLLPRCEDASVEYNAIYQEIEWKYFLT